MSGLRGLVPATVAIGLGIFTGINGHLHPLSSQQLSLKARLLTTALFLAIGYYTFHPAIQQLNAERRTMNP